MSETPEWPFGGWTVASLYVTRQGLEVILGLLACLYGGSFTKSIAVIEALNVTGTWSTVVSALRALHGHVDVVVAAERADAGRESMGGLHARGEYGRILTRKLSVTASAIKDPRALQTSLSALWSATATVLAALRVKFARVLVLGVSMSECVRPLAMRQLAPALAAALTREHRQWAPTLVDGAVKALTVSVAWRLARFVSAWHSAARGGAVCATALGKFAKDRGYVPPRLALASDEKPYKGSDSTGPVAFGLYADEVLGFLLAAAGLAMQLSKGFRLPPLLRLLFAPALLCEGLLGILFLGLK